MKKFLFSAIYLSICLICIGDPTKSMLGADWTEILSEDTVVPVEYLEGYGGAYIDTGLNSSIDKFRDFEIAFKISDFVDSMPIGYSYGATARYGLWKGQTASDSTLYYVGINNTQKVSYPRDTEWHEVKVYNGSHIEIDGVSTPIGSGSVRSNIGLFLFATITSSSGSSSYYTSHGRIYYARIYDVNRVLLRDYMPVRVLIDDEWIGAMYDLVSGELFLNKGTGEFIIGPDKE